MAFGSLFGPKGKLALQAQDSCLPGELIPIGIQVTIDNEIKPREVRAELVGEETFYVTETRHSGGHVSTQTVQKNEIFASLIETLAEQPSLYKGVEQKWGCFLKLPSEAPPTCRGKLVNIRWKLKAVLDVPKSIDLSREKPLIVFCQPHDGGGTADWPVRQTFSEVALDLEAPPAASAGDTLICHLILQAKEKLSIRGIRGELVRIEEAGVRRDDEVISKTQVSGAGSFWPNESPSFEFSLDIPAEAPPTAACRRSSLRWKVRAVIDRRMKADFNVEQELYVYNSPSS